MPTATTNKLLPGIRTTIDTLISEFDRITNDRRAITQELTSFIDRNRTSGQEVALNFICTHNSRRSHIAQIWAQCASYFYGIKYVRAFSGGTQATAFNARAVDALKRAGFDIVVGKGEHNPVYEVKYAYDAPSLTVFSKKYDDILNPKNGFAAIMTCSHADETCPVITGASERIALTYDDPKDFDGTPLEAEKYSERVQEIGREILYAFSKVNKVVSSRNN
jgi:arsenate reductase (thioredoxin)